LGLGLAFLYPGPLYLLAALAVAVAMDAVYPYHSGILLRVHPVHTSFVLAMRLYRPRASRAWGAVLWLTVMALHITVYAAALLAAWLAGPVVWIEVLPAAPLPHLYSPGSRNPEESCPRSRR